MTRIPVLAMALFACNVEPMSGDTGGVPPGEGGPCPDGVTVVLSDYASTQIALGAPDGSTESPSFLSTASAETEGLAFPLSGDVIVPSERPPSGRVVVVDRYGTNVISWADPQSARVLGQLSVATGFESNPQDYIEVGPDRAYVARFGHNLDAGREPFDAGDDVLVIDTRAPAILGRIPLPFEGDFPPRPGRFLRVGERVLVTLGREANDFRSAGDAELVALDPATDTLAWRLEIPGFRNCGRAALSPDGSVLVLGCSGELDFDGNAENLGQSGLVLFDATLAPPVELARFQAAALAGEAIQNDPAFASDRWLLFKTQTALGGTTANRLLGLDRQTGSVAELVAARDGSDGGGLGVVFGGLVCSPGCSDLCLMADADRGVLERLRVEGGAVRRDGSVTVETRVGLPPLALTYR